MNRNPMLLILVLSAITASVQSLALAQCQEWVKRTTAYFPPGYDGTPGHVVYDSVRNHIFVQRVLGPVPAMETWSWSGQSWIRMIPGTQPPYNTQSDFTDVAFDAARGVAVMYGASGKTWEWNGENWAQKSGSGPTMYRLVYHSTIQQVIGFGYDGPAGTLPPNLFGWNGATWSALPQPDYPPWRTGDSFALAYDTVRDVVVLFGGINFPTNLNDTWEWDGTTWNQAFPQHSPPARYVAQAAYDSLRRKTVLIGGRAHPSTFFTDTWEWDGEDWVQVPTTVQPGTQASAWDMAFDSGRGKAVLYYNGGSPTGAPSEVWEFPASSPPVIHEHPSNAVVCLGDAVIFSVMAVGDSPLAYQWRRNGRTIPGATSSSHVIASADLASIGTFDVVVTNACGSSTSGAAALIVCAGPSGCPSPADVNGDGNVDGLDIQRIVDVLLGY